MSYRYSMNKTLLAEQLYPLLRQSTNFYSGWLQEGADGRLHMPLSVSPEFGSTNDTCWDLSLLRWSLKTLINIATNLLPDEAVSGHMLPIWKKTLERLAPYPVDPVEGLMVGEQMPLSHGHRHWS